MKILNLYAGIGGNRKLWGDEHEIIAIESNQDIANVYKMFYPNDTMIVTNAHEYLLNNYKEFDFIWSSPPCPTHSRIRRLGVHTGQNEALYPDMTLYQEIILLQQFAKNKWCVENVIPYYKPLIEGTILQRHIFWSNFYISNKQSFPKDDATITNMRADSMVYCVDLKDVKITNKIQILRNMVNPQLGLYILNQATKINKSLFDI